jgi:hypothetical protein
MNCIWNLTMQETDYKKMSCNLATWPKKWKFVCCIYATNGHPMDRVAPAARSRPMSHNKLSRNPKWRSRETLPMDMCNREAESIRPSLQPELKFYVNHTHSFLLTRDRIISLNRIFALKIPSKTCVNAFRYINCRLNGKKMMQGLLWTIVYIVLFDQITKSYFRSPNSYPNNRDSFNCLLPCLSVMVGTLSITFCWESAKRFEHQCQPERFSNHLISTKEPRHNSSHTVILATTFNKHLLSIHKNRSAQEKKRFSPFL